MNRIIPFLALVSLSSPCFAQEATPKPQNGADYSDTNLKFEVTPGVLENRDRQIEVQAGGTYNPATGATGGELKLDLEKRYLIGGSDPNWTEQGYRHHQGYDTGGVAVLFGVHGTVQGDSTGNKYKLQKADLTGPGMSMYRYRDVWTNVYANDGKKTPTADVEVLAPSVRPVYRYDAPAKSEQGGASIVPLDVSAHWSAKINGTNTDYTLFVRPAEFILGAANIGSTKSSGAYNARLGLGAGVQLGQVGRLGVSTSAGWGTNFRNDANSDIMHQASVVTDLGLSKIGGTPLEVGVSHEYRGSFAAQTSVVGDAQLINAHIAGAF
jgi:hypothetical protein